MNSEEKNFTADNLSMNEKKIAQILAGLPRVEAPGDFEIGVRARIANAQPSRPRRFSTAAVIGFAAPAILVLAAGVFVYLGLARQTPEIAMPKAETPSHQAEQARTELPESPVTNVSTSPASTEASPTTRRSTEVAGIVPNNNRRVQKVSEKRDDRTGSSRDETFRSTNKVILPRGLSPDAPVSTKDDGKFNRNTSVGIRDVLAVLGIEAEFQGSAWRVKGLSAQSAAQRSGVKAGDIIQSVDGRRLKEDTKFSGSFSGRTLKIVREGKSMDLDLKDQKSP